jgi:hypothetical protein
MPLKDHIIPDPYRAPTDAEIAKARAMYVEKFTVSRILAATNMALGTLYYWLDGGPLDEQGRPRLPPIPRRRAAVLGKRRKPVRTDHGSLASRLFCTAERQVRDIEERLSKPGAGPERERDLRMLLMLVRSLRELSAFNAGASLQGAPAAEPPVPDVDALRQKLARRLDQLVAEARERFPDERQQGMADTTPDPLA